MRNTRADKGADMTQMTTDLPWSIKFLLVVLIYFTHLSCWGLPAALTMVFGNPKLLLYYFISIPIWFGIDFIVTEDCCPKMTDGDLYD